jgi:hypothetical protein
VDAGSIDPRDAQRAASAGGWSRRKRAAPRQALTSASSRSTFLLALLTSEWQAQDCAKKRTILQGGHSPPGVSWNRRSLVKGEERNGHRPKRVGAVRRKVPLLGRRKENRANGSKWWFLKCEVAEDERRVKDCRGSLVAGGGWSKPADRGRRLVQPVTLEANQEDEARCAPRGKRRRAKGAVTWSGRPWNTSWAKR